MLTPRSRRLVAALLLAAYAGASTGMPLPGPVPPRMAGERFPCELCRCGCASAEVCWNDCCCHTLAERLAWADQEGVSPPEAALDKAECAGLDVSLWRSATSVLAIAASPTAAGKACCCCAKDSKPASQDNQHHEPIRSWRSLACHSILTLWVSLSVALPAPADDATPSPRAVEPAATLTPLLAGITTPPDSPPPERLASRF